VFALYMVLKRSLAPIGAPVGVDAERARKDLAADSVRLSGDQLEVSL
jgi:hypothetical protein